MSLRNSERKKLGKPQTEYKPITENNINQSSVRRATTCSDRLPLEIQMLATAQEQYNTNPFLKAKLKAFLNHINASKDTFQLQKRPLSKCQSPTFFSDEMVTFKDMSEQQKVSNRQTVCELSKKLKTTKDNGFSAQKPKQ